MKKSIHAHVTYNTKRVSDELINYHYSIAIHNSESNIPMDIINGNKEFKNYSQFYDNIEKQILTYYGKTIENENVIISDFNLKMDNYSYLI